MLADVRYALRLFARSPLFSLAVVLVLGLGIGASTTVFTLVDAYLLKPLPFHEPERLVSLWHTARTNRQFTYPFSEPDFVDLREQAQTFSGLAAVTGVGVNLSGGLGPGGSMPESVLGSRVSAEFFPMLGVRPAIGRAFTADESRPGHEQVVVLSDALWRRRFGADPSALGRAIAIDGRPHQIVGVMPADFRTPLDLGPAPQANFWLPAAMPGEHGAQRDWHSWSVLGRLKPGVSIATADAEIQAIAARLEQAHPDTNANKSFMAVSLHEQLVGGLKPALTLLFCATFLLLFIASANVALLLLARAAGREGEAAVRSALGASRGRLVRQFLAEGLALSLAGGLVGFALASFGVDLVASGYAGAAPALREVRPDARAFAFVLLLASLTGLGFGLAPALRASKARLAGLLKEGATRATAGAERRRTQAVLLVAEIALSTVLLAGSAGVARGFYKALRQPMGFKPESALTFSVRLPEARYRDAATARAFYDALLERLKATHSVSSAGAANFLPLSSSRSGTGSTNGHFSIEGKPPFPPGSGVWTMYHRVGGDYFAAMGMPLLRGRSFTDADREKGAPVAIVSEAFARRFLPDEDPIGKRVRLHEGGDLREIVGVVSDVHYGPGWAPVPTATYTPLSQEASVKELNFASFIVRGEANPRALADAAREAPRSLDAELPLIDIKTYDERTSEILVDRRFTLTLVSSFALSALVLTALGLFGLVSYQTRRRSRELAIRMALGAASADVQRLVLRDTSRLLVAGLALGLPAAFAAGRLLASKLEGVPPTDPLSLVATALLLGLVALAAVLTPARRAARTPPALVLRDD